MREQTAAGPRAGACRLRRFGDGETALWAGPAGLWGIEIWKACGFGYASWVGRLRACGRRCLPLRGKVRAAPGDEVWVCCSLTAACHPVASTHLTRGKGGCGVLASAALPRWGKGRCRCACSTLFALRGKSASELARRILAGSRERVFCGAFCPSGNFPGAPGNGDAGHISSPLLFAANIRSEAYGRDRFFPLYHLFAPAKGHLPALPAAPPSPDHPAGRPAGSARTRSRVQTLENPFLGTATVSPAAPVPQRRSGPLSWARRYSHHRPARTEPQHTRPLLVGRACVESEPTALAGGTAAS